MSTIPKEEIEKIEAEAKNRYGQLYNLSKGIWTANEMLKNIEGAFSAGARWMHEQLATDGREELEKELELYKKKVEFYREQTDKVRELIFSRNDIGEPCQPLYDAIFDKIQAIQSQCTEKEKECEDWKDAVKKWQELYRIETERLEELKAENERLKGALNYLVMLKDHKDQDGKDAFYNENQPKAWDNARKLLNK